MLWLCKCSSDVEQYDAGNRAEALLIWNLQDSFVNDPSARQWSGSQKYAFCRHVHVTYRQTSQRSS